MGEARRLAAVVLALIALAGCNIAGLVGTEIEIRGARRSLQEQVLGSYQQIGEEVYLLAGVRSVDPLTGAPSPPPPMTASQERALAARRRMEFNRDDVLAFQRERLVGEGRDGLPAVFEGEVAELQEADPRRAALVRAVVAEENADRLTIMRRIVRTTPELRGEEGLEAVRRILAARYAQEAEPGMLVQRADGTWVAKGEGR